MVSLLTRNWMVGLLLTATLTGGMAKAESAAAATGCAPLVAIPNARQPVPGVLTGGQPTRAQLEQAAGAGYKTVVNLRALSEDGAWDERKFVNQLGMRFVHLPISGPRDVNRANAAALRETLRDAAGQPILVHCASGNRVGALFAVGAALLDGATVDDALELGRDAGLTRLEPATRDYLTEVRE